MLTFAVPYWHAPDTVTQVTPLRYRALRVAVVPPSTAVFGVNVELTVPSLKVTESG